MTAPTHAWLRRLSDYHSGGVAEAERIAVEEHLATCTECQEALAMYRRFYTLLRSPLRLGGPSAHFDDSTVPVATRPAHPTQRPTQRPAPPSRPREPRNRLALAGIAAALAAALIIAGFVAVIGSRLHGPTVASTPSPQISPTSQPSATASPIGSKQSVPGAFVCANPQGSRMTYAYVRGDGNLYSVTGCATPRLLMQNATPLAWSPSNRYLSVGQSGTAVQIIDIQTGAITHTHYGVFVGGNPQAGDTVRLFFGWLDDSSFLGAITTITDNPHSFLQSGPTTLVRVDVASGRETTLGSISGWANVNCCTAASGVAGWINVRIVAHGRYLFYAGYDSAGTSGYLHRFDLATGTDTQLVSLGEYTFGGCQADPVCGWTAPWDVSADGTHILYHHPGPSNAPSDTGGAKDTPVLYATLDGTGASMPFGTQLASSIVTPVFSPDGTAAVASGAYGPPGLASMPQMKVVRMGGTPALVTGNFDNWRGDSAALVLEAAGGAPGPLLYDLATGKTTPLEANSYNYLWGN